MSVIDEDTGETYAAAKEEFDSLWERTLPLSQDLIAEYKTRLYYSIERWDMDYDIANAETKPNYMQRRASCSISGQSTAKSRFSCFC